MTKKLFVPDRVAAASLPKGLDKAMGKEEEDKNAVNPSTLEESAIVTGKQIVS
jgi:hypothetical protein